MIIWGFRARNKRLDGGHFHCPNEGGDRDYDLMQARRWFTLFFIPLIPLKVLGEFVACRSCDATYDPQVLDLQTTAQMEDRLTTALRHVVVAMLTADEVVDAAEREAALEVMQRFGHRPYAAADLDRDLATLEVGTLDDEVAELGAMLTPQGHEALVRACLHLATADGHVDERELAVVQQAARGIGMSPAHLRGILAELTTGREPA